MKLYVNRNGWKFLPPKASADVNTKRIEPLTNNDEAPQLTT